MNTIIFNIRYGIKSIKDLSNQELNNIMDYNLPYDVFELCCNDIRRRRKENLGEGKE